MHRSISISDAIASATVGAVTIVIMLALVPGAAARHAATTTDLDHLRVCVQDFTVWSKDHDDLMPNAGLPNDRNADWFYRDVPDRDAAYPSQARAWPQVLARHLGSFKHEWHSTAGFDDLNGAINLSHYPDEQSRIKHLPTLYRYSMTMLTDPDLWSDAPAQRVRTHAEQAAHYQLVRTQRIASPARKGIILHRAFPSVPPVWQVAFADGSVHDKDPDAALPAAVLATSPTGARGIPVLETLHGYLGVDF